VAADLHIHTTVSDGTCTPEEVVHLAAQRGLYTIAITDHESVDGYFQAKAVAEATGVHLIPGVELLTGYNGREVHLLGYFMEPISPQFLNRVNQLRVQRNQVSRDIVTKLRQHGFQIQWEAVESKISDNGVIGKNHIISAIKEAGYIHNRLEAIEFLRTYLSCKGLAYIEFTQHALHNAVDLIHSHGGIPVIAHPGLLGDDQMVIELLRRYDVGLEVFYYYLNHKTRDEWNNRYQWVAEKHNILQTGGSDFHGANAPVELGSIRIPNTMVEKLLQNLAVKVMS